MNKGKQNKWNKKLRKEMEKQGKPPMKINVIRVVTDEKDKRRKGTLKLNKDNLAEFEKGTLTSKKGLTKKPKRFKGICLNWPEEVK